MPNPVTQAVYCTLVVPTYNAADFIETSVLRLRRFVAEHPAWCVLFVCDGCTDGTAEKLSALIAGDGPGIQAEVYTQNRGKGYAVRRGMALAKTAYRFYTDVDLAYDPDEALKLLKLLEAGADLAVVNRASPDSCFLISPRDFPTIYKRHVMSRSFNWWLRKMLPISILDTQAGLKGMTAAAWEKIGPQLSTDGFFIDVEILAWAGLHGMRVDETPIVFKYVDPTTVRMVSHGWHMIFDTLRLRKHLSRFRREERRSTAVQNVVKVSGVL